MIRKDFMLEAYQIYESRALGADCILLIMACLENDKAMELEDIAINLGMDVLIEVHDEDELARALQLRSKLIGVNNRDLRTFKTNLETGKRLSKFIPPHYIKVCESGIYKNSEIKDMMANGFSAFLVGESLMRENDIEKATKELIGN
jgi:indole-3-glycerol phosphate synthase